MAAKKKNAVPSKFGPTMQEPYPSEMRRQLWPLCCGASIISGFKDVAMMEENELVERINAVVKAIPDHQVFVGEQINPRLTFLTLNSGQMGSKKIMDAIAKAGFVKFMEAKPRGNPQGFFVRDESNSVQVIAA